MRKRVCKRRRKEEPLWDSKLFYVLVQSNVLKEEKKLGASNGPGRHQGGRKGPIGQPWRHQGGRKGLIGQPARH